MIEQSKSGVVNPPPAPEVGVRLRFRPLQAVGIALIALFPVSALWGVFGETSAEVSAAGPELELHVQYPTRFRYKMLDALQIRVHNRSARQLDRVLVKFDENYISQFSNVVFTPEARRAYDVELTEMRPGETRLVSVEVQAEEYGRHQGTVTTTAGDGNPAAAVDISTIVFP